MGVVVVYKDASDHARDVISFMRDFSRQTGRTIEVIDPETREGIDFCRSYDIVEYPTLLALDDRGSVLSMWRGRLLPTINEVSYYARHY